MNYPIINCPIINCPIINCPIINPTINSDPNFDKLLFNIGIKPQDKILAFLAICIMLRLLAAGITNVYSDAKYTPYLIAFISFCAIFIIGQNLCGDQWWSRKSHFIIAICLFIASMHQITSNTRNKSLAYLLYADVLIGISTFSYVLLICPSY